MYANGNISILLYLDSSLKLCVYHATPAEATSLVNVDGRTVMGPVVSTPEAFIARADLGLPARRGLVLGVYKRVGMNCPMFSKNSFTNGIYSAVKEAGWYSTRKALEGNVTCRPGGREDMAVILLPGVSSDSQCNKLGCRWDTLRCNNRAEMALESFIRNFHMVAYHI